jgi:hypothetical protein
MATAVDVARESINWMAPVPEYPLYGNDVYGDCVPAGAGHHVQVWSANSGKLVTPDQNEILRIYHQLSPNDTGLVMLDFLNWWTKNSIAGVKLGAFVEVNVRNQNEIKLTIERFGGLFAGWDLPISAQNQDVWDADDTPNGDAGSWGRHCWPLMEYMNGTVGGPTWGLIKLAKWAFVSKYLSEAYALISKAWMDGSGKSPEGLDIDALNAELKVVQA